jgi:hypothetical protein
MNFISFPGLKFCFRNAHRINPSKDFNNGIESSLGFALKCLKVHISYSNLIVSSLFNLILRLICPLLSIRSMTAHINYLLKARSTNGDRKCPRILLNCKLAWTWTPDPFHKTSIRPPAGSYARFWLVNLLFNFLLPITIPSKLELPLHSLFNSRSWSFKAWVPLHPLFNSWSRSLQNLNSF